MGGGDTCDLVIRGGIVYDGSGAPGVRADVGVRGDRIASVGRIEGRGAVEVDATGMAVAPGFIDVHTHGTMIDILNHAAPARRSRCLSPGDA